MTDDEDAADAPLLDPDDIGPAPDEVVELAASCVDYVRNALRIELDLTPDTLPLLDHWVGHARVEASERPELCALLARTVGAYLGEVLRRMFPCFWLIPSPDVHEWRLCFSRVFLAVNPVGLAHDALSGITTHAGPSSELVLLPGERDEVAARLSALPEVAEDEFLLLSTRVEGIEIAVEALRAFMLREGIEEMVYEAEDYAQR